MVCMLLVNCTGIFRCGMLQCGVLHCMVLDNQIVPVLLYTNGMYPVYLENFEEQATTAAPR